MADPKKIALVIGWGSVKCAAALGLLRVLNREGIELDMVVASGGGSIYGAMVALGFDIEEIVEMNQRLFTHEATHTANRLAVLQLLLPKIFKIKKYFNLLDDRLVNEGLKEAMEDRTFADTKIPLFISTTDYETGERVSISQGSIYEAVRASIALPLVFPPLEKDGRLLADGFLSDPLPVGLAMQEGANIILAIGFESISTGDRNSFSDYLYHLSGILSNNLLQASTAFYTLTHHAEVFSIVPNFEEEIHMFDTHKVPDIIKVGEEKAEKMLPKLKQVLGMSA
jgi:NTE family protein